MKKEPTNGNMAMGNKDIQDDQPYSSIHLKIILFIAFTSFLVVFLYYFKPHPTTDLAENVVNDVGKFSNFLLSIIGMVMAIGITNLVKGFDVLIKYWPEEKKYKVSKSRFGMRLFWGVNILFLTIQLVWGMRLALDEAASFSFFLYYGFLGSLVYAMIVYVFPENIESVFKKEEQERSDLYWSPSIVKRLCKLYLLFGLYMAATIPMSYIFWYNCYIKVHVGDNPKGWEFFTASDGNLLGLIAKTICVAVVWRGLLIKKKKWKALCDSHKNESGKKRRGVELVSAIALSDYGIIKIYKQKKKQREELAISNPSVITLIDYAIIGFSIFTSGLYVALRWNDCCFWW